MKVGSWNFTSMRVREDGKIWLSIETPWTHESRVMWNFTSAVHEDGKMAKY
jgi:hypothetical protein